MYDDIYQEICDIAVKQLTAAFSISLYNRGYDKAEIISVLQDSCEILMRNKEMPEIVVEECNRMTGLKI